MTERKIQDYIPYYLGREILLMASGGEEVVCTIVNASMYGGSYVTGTTKDGRTYNSHGTQEGAKLILRPLSDMAYEEFVEAGKIHISEGGTIAVTFDEVRSNTVLPMRPKTFAYLLSKGFDLFNLIPDGLAINKSTLKP